MTTSTSNVSTDQIDKPKDYRREKYSQNKLIKRLRRETGKAIADFNMIEADDRVMVCLSGGKDSYAMLDILLHLQQHAPIDFSLVAVNLDQKQPGFPIPEGRTTCSLCSRLRRGILYRTAGELGATKIALGHHMDDMVETLFLNMFHGARLKSMPAKLVSDDKKNVVIRPLAYCREKDIVEFAQIQRFPIIPCNLCGSQENLQRKQVKSMLAEWEKVQPGRVVNIFKSMQRVTKSHLFDTDLFDFANLSVADADNLAELDIGFDE